MADTPSLESPVVTDHPRAGDAALTLHDESATEKTIVRADPAAADAIGVGFGASRIEGPALVCGQRPGEWVLFGPAGATEEVALRFGLTGHVSVIDHTHSRALFRLTGDDAPRALEKVCSLDWSDDMTPDGAVTSASVAKLTCDVIRNDVGDRRSYLIACDRSFGQYLFDALLDAGQEHGIGVV